MFIDTVDSIYPLSETKSFRYKGYCVAIICAMVMHGLGLFVFQSGWLNGGGMSDLLEEEQPLVLELDLTQYVEVNPEVEENEPDRSEWYSFQNQQAANWVEHNEVSVLPYVKGTQVDSVKIVKGSVDELESEQKPGVYELVGSSDELVDEQEMLSEVVVAQLQAPSDIRSSEKDLELSSDGVGVLDQESREWDEAPTKQWIPLSLDTMNELNKEGEVKPLDVPIPKLRPRVSAELIEGPLMDSSASPMKRGAIAIDALFSEFGAYEKQFFAALQRGWYNEIDYHKPLDSGTTVLVTFVLKSSGVVDSVQAVESNASVVATLICENALKNLSPFRTWTREMVQLFGREKEFKIRFHYY